MEKDALKEIIDHFQSFSKAKLKYKIKPSRQGDIPFVCATMLN